jgi:dynein heavy chain, axonemal
MMFETQDLRVASPATVSRCGMVYLEPVNLGYEPIIDTWIQRLENKDSKNSEQKGDQEDEENGEEKEKRDDSPKRSSSEGEKADLLRKLKDLAKNLKKFMKELLQLVREECKEKVPSVDVNLVQSCINLINCMIDPEEVDIKKMEKNFFNQVLVFALIWSVGANLDDVTRSRFSQVFKLKITSLIVGTYTIII